MKRTWRERIIIASILLFFMTMPAIGGLVGKSEYDTVYKITVMDCHGNTTIYNDCRITNAGQFWISFMPEQGRIASGNGKEIHINTNDACIKVVKEEIR